MNTALLRIVFLPVCVLGPCLSAIGQQPPPLTEAQIRSAAVAFVDAVRTESICPPSWKDATVTGVETVDGAVGHICRLSIAGKPEGYVFVCESDGQVIPVMFSGTSPPLAWASRLRVPTSNPAIQLFPEPAATDAMPMVASFECDTPSFQLKPIACAVTSVVAHLQANRRLPLLYRIEDEELFRVAMSEHVYGLSEAARSEAERRSRNAAGEFSKRLRASLRQSQLVEDATVPVRDPALVRHPRSLRVHRIKGGIATFDVSIPIREECLSALGGPPERWDILREEARLAAASFDDDKSLGMVDAFVIQRAYMDREPSPEKGVEAFFRSRGFRTTCQRKAIADVSEDELPCVLLGPDGTAGVLMHLGARDAARWGLVCIPETVTPLRRTLGEKLADLKKDRASRTSGSEPIKLPGPTTSFSVPPEVAQKAHEVASTVKARRQERLAANVTDDPTSDLPVSLDNGVHMVQLECFSADWRALVITGITPISGSYQTSRPSP